MTAPQIAYEVIRQGNPRGALRKNNPRNGYPYGTYNDEVVDVLKTCGILCADYRTAKEFDLPSDRLRLDPHVTTKTRILWRLRKNSLTKVTFAPQMFYLWGHSYEFEADNNWEVIRTSQIRVSRPDIWYQQTLKYSITSTITPVSFSAQTQVL